MTYIDGFVLAVPEGNKEAYREMASKAVDMFKGYGATRVVECWGDDVPDGETTDFRRAVKAEPDETVLFSWIEWPSKAVRDEGMQKVRTDPQMHGTDMPFDSKRMIFGGFEPIIDD